MENLVLEGLYRMRSNLAEGEYVYQDWTRCSVGHVYMAVKGKKARSTAVTLTETNTDTVMKGILDAILDANPNEEVAAGYGTAPIKVSYLTCMVTANLFGVATDDNGNWQDEQLRTACLLMVNNAIEKIEAEQREAMLEVARWTQVEDREPALV